MRYRPHLACSTVFATSRHQAADATPKEEADRAEGLVKSNPTLTAFAKEQCKKDPDFASTFGPIKTDPTIAIMTDKPAKSDGQMTWGDEQIEPYRERYALGTMARLPLELVLNVAARRNDARLIGRQHLSFNTKQQFLGTDVAPDQDEKATDGPRAALVAGRTRCDAAHRCLDVLAHRARAAIQIGGGVRQQVCRLGERSRTGARQMRRPKRAQLPHSRSPQGGMRANGQRETPPLYALDHSTIRRTNSVCCAARPTRWPACLFEPQPGASAPTASMSV